MLRTVDSLANEVPSSELTDDDDHDNASDSHWNNPVEPRHLRELGLNLFGEQHEGVHARNDPELPAEANRCLQATDDDDALNHRFEEERQPAVPMRHLLRFHDRQSPREPLSTRRFEKLAHRDCTDRHNPHLSLAVRNRNGHAGNDRHDQHELPDDEGSDHPLDHVVAEEMPDSVESLAMEVSLKGTKPSTDLWSGDPHCSQHEQGHCLMDCPDIPVEERCQENRGEGEYSRNRVNDGKPSDSCHEGERWRERLTMNLNGSEDSSDATDDRDEEREVPEHRLRPL